jgi:PAS domain S-box-containing protein
LNLYSGATLATKKPVFFEDSRDGYYFETCIHPVLNNNEEVIYFATYARDITSRKNTEQEIQLSKQKLESIFNEIQDVVWSVSTSEDAYILMTPSAEKLYGYSLQDFTEDRNLWEKVIHPDDKHIIPALEKKLAEAGFAEEEYRIITKSGEIKWISKLRSSPDISLSAAMAVPVNILPAICRKCVNRLWFWRAIPIA